MPAIGGGGGASLLEWVGAYLGRGLAEDLRVLRSIKALRRGTPFHRWVAALDLGAAFPYCSSWLRPRIRKALSAAASDSDGRTRASVLLPLAQIGPDVAAERCVEALNRDPDGAVRAQAARVLRTCGDDSAIPALREALHSDPEEQVRVSVLGTLCELGAPDILELAVGRLQLGRPLERWCAAQGLANLGRTDAVPALQTALRAETDKLARRFIASALGRLGEPGTQALVEVLAAAGGDAGLRRSICLGLELSDTPLAAETLGRLLDDPDRTVRHAVPWAATRIEGPGRREVIRRALQHPFPGVRREALRALAQRGRPDDRALIEPLTADPWRSVREAAAEAVESIQRPRWHDA